MRLDSARIVFEKKHIESILIGNMDLHLSTQLYSYCNWTWRRAPHRGLSELSLSVPAMTAQRIAKEEATMLSILVVSRARTTIANLSPRA
jgi:hypothetical protein